MPRPSTPAELPLSLDKKAAGSIPAQLAEQVRNHILAGNLRPGDYLPSSRALAQRLAISRGSVVSAYEQLAGEGYLESNRGGTYLAENLELQKSPDAPSATTGQEKGKDTAPPAPSLRFDLTPGIPDTSLLTSASWRAAWRRAAAEPGTSYPAQGSPELRNQLAEHLRIMRYVVRQPQEIMVTAGARDGFRLLLSTLRQQEHSRPLRIAVENPGYPSLHKIPAAFGHEILPISLDRYGLDPRALPSPAPDLVLVAPSHQYPLGASMPASRRLELLHWAEQNRAYIVEDDYDSELRYVGQPLPALAALARQSGIDRVITLGSFTKTLAPGIGLGYLLAPAALQPQIEELRQTLGSPVAALTQDAMTHFLADGGARRHIARMRRFYRRRRTALLQALEEAQLPEQIQVLPMDGGLHLVLALQGNWANRNSEQQLVKLAQQAGLDLAALSDYWAQAGAGCGLIIGFGAVSENQLNQAVKILGQIICSLPKPAI